MNPQKQRRKRGVILTPEGWQKFQKAKMDLELQENYGDRYKLEELSDRAGLNPSTVAKILARQEGVDKQTLEIFFTSFNLILSKDCYSNAVASKYQDWGEAIDVSMFCGRTDELVILEEWLLKDNCRLVAILGMGGIGKTTLSIKLAKQIQDRFEYVIWQSLRDAPPINTILSKLNQFLYQEQETEANSSKTTSEKISRLITRLREHRCLIILDNIESILASGSRSGQYLKGYEEYGQLFKEVGEVPHQSCLLITSREKPKEVVLLQGETLPVRSFRINGLQCIDGQEILKIKGLSGTPSELSTLVNHYAGNVLALKVVATTIQDLFDGDVSDFFKQETGLFGDIYELLDQQFERLSDLEKSVMYWLAINRDSITLSELKSDFVLNELHLKLFEALESLGRRSLIEKASPTLLERSTSLFTLQPVVMEYVTRHFREQICKEIITQDIKIFRSHAILKATAKDYIRHAQNRFILEPIIDGLIAVFTNKINLENHLKEIIARLQKEFPLQVGYTSGNILNLFCHLKTNLNGYDFSDLNIWQAYLHSVNLHDVNLQNANLTKCVFTDTIGGIHSVVFSPNGELLATGDTNDEVRLYQVADGKLMLICKGHTDWVWPVTFNPQGTVIASGSVDQTIKLWDVSTGQCLKTLYGHNGGIWSLAFNSDNGTLASGSDDKTVKLWNLNTGKCLKTFQGHSNRVTSVAFSPCGNILASGSDDHLIYCWDIKTGNRLNILEGHTRQVWSIAFSSDGQTLVSGSHDQTIKVWDIKTTRCLRTLQDHSDCVNSVTFVSNDRMVASGSDDKTVKLWDVNTGRCVSTLRGHSSRVWSVAVNLNSGVIASGSDDQTVKLWDINTNQCFKSLHGYCNGIWSVAFSPQGDIVASGSGDQTVKLWDTDTGRCLETWHGHSNRVTSVAFSPNGRMLASASEDQTVKLWDTKTGECIKTCSGHSNRVVSVAFNPEGRLLASSSDDQTVKLWNVDTGRYVQSLEGHTNRVWSVAFSPQGKILASGCLDQIVRLWDISTGRCIATLSGHIGGVWSVAFSPDGSILASGSSDQTIKLWDVNTSQCIATLQGHRNCVYSLVFVNDLTLVSGSGDQTVRCWDIKTNNCVETLLGHTKLVWSVAYNNQQKILVSASEDETIKLWDILSSKCLKTLRSKRPYEGTNIIGTTGITEDQKTTLKALGALDSKLLMSIKDVSTEILMD
ncbi:NACHT domain-containing protein [Mastigocladus laminosus UU774]|nr:hypothetical protein B4U84_27435 [Westiellopsis prolifica IICB1]TFI51218.1 NACHT domain-containing protein [Mastigocladus laminosus UU774]